MEVKGVERRLPELLRWGWAPSAHSCHPEHLPRSRASPALAVSGEGRGREFCFVCVRDTVTFFTVPFKSRFESRNSALDTNDRFEGESNNAKPPARTDFPVIEDGNSKTKDRFLPSRNSLFIAAKATQNSRQTFHYFSPTVWKYGKRKSCHDIFFSFHQKWHFFSPLSSVNKWLGMTLLVLGRRTDSAKKEAWMGDSLQEIVKLLRKQRPLHRLSSQHWSLWKWWKYYLPYWSPAP